MKSNNFRQSKQYIFLSRLLLILTVLLVLSGAENIRAQSEKEEPQKITLEPQKGKGKRDKNIEKTNQTRRPPSGDTVCRVEIKNNTPQFVMIYINDLLFGTIAGNTTFKTDVNIGRIKVYTRTERNNDGFLYWGPNYFNCGTAQKDGAVLLEINPAKIL
jgi:hypothetical protein